MADTTRYVPPPVDNLPRGFSISQGDTIQLDAGSDLRLPLLIERKIEKGGFGTVYRVKATDGNRYALKILDFWEKLPMEWPSLKKRFDISFGARQIHSDFVVKYFHKGSFSGNPCITMELCEGGNLEDRVNEFANWGHFQLMAVRLLLGLLALHKAGVIHRDIKPKNILFDEQDYPKITDFDLSAFLANRLTNPNPRKVKEIWFTPIFAPPEQKDPKLAFLSTTPAMDMFSVGVTFYFVLTRGQYPWGGQESFYENPEAYYKLIEDRQYIPISQLRPDLPYSWVAAIHACLEPDRDNRMAGPIQFLEQVDYRSILSAYEHSVAVDGPIAIPEASSTFEEAESTTSALEMAKVWSLQILDGCGIAGIRINGLFDEATTQQPYLTVGREGLAGEIVTGHLCFDEFPKSETHYWVSRRHATLRLNDGKLEIRDGRMEQDGWVASTNGTEVYNPLRGTQHEITATAYEELLPGDIVSLAGTVNFKIEID